MMLMMMRTGTHIRVRPSIPADLLRAHARVTQFLTFQPTHIGHTAILNDMQTHTYVHSYIYTYTHIYIHHACMHTYMYTHIHTYIHTTYIHTHIHKYIHTSCMHTYKHIHTYIHTYMHTHIHTCIPSVGAQQPKVVESIAVLLRPIVKGY